MKVGFGTGYVLALSLTVFAAFAQEATNDDEEIGPAVDTSAIENSSPVETRDAEIDALEPGVETPVLSEDVTRRTSGTRVMDEIELGRTEITGNQELPKVLYIVPWKRADPGDLLGRPVNTLLDDVLAPIDREEFVRQVGYYDDLYGSDEE